MFSGFLSPEGSAHLNFLVLYAGIVLDLENGTCLGEGFFADASQPDSTLCCRCSCALEWRSAVPRLPREALLLPGTPDGAQLRFLDFTGAVWHSSGECSGARLSHLAGPVECPTGVRVCRWPLLCSRSVAGSEKTLRPTVCVSLHSYMDKSSLSGSLTLRRASRQLAHLLHGKQCQPRELVHYR